MIIPWISILVAPAIDRDGGCKFIAVLGGIYVLILYISFKIKIVKNLFRDQVGNISCNYYDIVGGLYCKLLGYFGLL